MKETDRSYMIHRWINDGSRMYHSMGYKWIIGESQIGHIWVTLSYRWVTYGSHMVTYGSQESQKWVTYESSVTLLNTTFHISKFTKLWPGHNFATFRIRKINLIFEQSEESNPVAFIVSYCDASQGCFLHIGSNFFQKKKTNFWKKSTNFGGKY